MIRGSFATLILATTLCSARPVFADEATVLLAEQATVTELPSDPSDLTESDTTIQAVSSSGSYSVEQRIAHLEQLVGQLQHRQQHHLVDDLSTQMSHREQGSGHWYASTEVSFLRPYLSGARSSSTSTGGKWIDPSYATSPRFTLGIRGESGLGLQVRYTGYNHGADLANVFGGGGFGVKLDSLETEITLRERFRKWDLDLGAGIRWGQYSITGDGVVTFPGRLTYKGIGPTFSVNGRRPLGDSRFSLLANFRGGLLLGEIHNTHPARGLAIGGVEDEIAIALENQIGLAWSRPIFNDAILEFRGVWETQFWLNETISDDVYGIGTNLGLSGPSVAVEIRY